MRDEKELTRLIEEQSALRRIATLVAAGIGEKELVDALTFEIGSLFSAQRANTMRWTGEAIEVIGEWSSDGSAVADGRVFEYGGDTLVTRVVRSRAPARSMRPPTSRPTLRVNGGANSGSRPRSPHRSSWAALCGGS